MLIIIIINRIEIKRNILKFIYENKTLLVSLNTLYGR